MLYVSPPQGEGSRVVGFGHGGSDGTAAWVWPQLDLMVLLFTQSRGTPVTISFEREMSEGITAYLAGIRDAGPSVRYRPETQGRSADYLANLLSIAVHIAPFS